MTLSALEAVLRLYRDPDRLAERLITLRLLTRPVSEMQALATRLQPLLMAQLNEHFDVSVMSMQGQIGSGALPIDLLPSMGLRIQPLKTKGAGELLKRLQKRLRHLPMPDSSPLRRCD